MLGSVASGEVCGRRDRGSNAAVALGSVAGDEFVDPGSGNAVGGGDLGRGPVLDDDGSDDQTGFGHPSSVKDCPLCPETSVLDVLNQHTSSGTLSPADSPRYTTDLSP